MKVGDGMRVELTAEAIQQFPWYKDKAGWLKVTPRGHHLVYWDGRKSADHFHDSSMLQPSGRPPAFGTPTKFTTSLRNREIRRRRKFLHEAFCAVRHDPMQGDFVSKCAKALGGREPVTPEIVAAAEAINRSKLSDFHPVELV